MNTKKSRKYYLLFLVAAMLSITSFAQSKIEVKGVVLDAESNMPLLGSTIMEKGTQNGTVVDYDGNYSIIVGSNAVIVASYIGYKTMEIPVAGETKIDFSLIPDNQQLSEIVVVAYGKQKKETITGSISTIQTKEIKQSPASNLAVTLAGRLPGLTSIQTSGEPGRDLTRLFLRGRGTINGQNPLILVDGVPRDITYIDPNEVESVSILKDASATAMFGVRGANGVILVTTKRGVAGKPEIGITAEYGLNSFTARPSQVTSYQHALLKNQSFENYNRNNNFVPGGNGYLQPTYSDEAIQHFKTGDDPVRYPDNDWADILMRDNVAQTRLNLNVSGGGDFVTYFINAGALDQGGQWKVAEKNDYDPSASLNRYNFRSNIDAYLNKSKTLKTFLNVAGYLEKVRGPAMTIPGANAGSAAGNTFFLLAGIWSTPPVHPGPLTPDGQVLSSQQEDRPAYGEINRSGYFTETRSNVIASFGMEQDLKFITPGLSTKFMMSFDSRALNNLMLAKNYERFVQNINGDGEVTYTRRDDNENTNLSSSTFNSFESYNNFQFFLTYDRTFGKHKVGALALFQRDKRLSPQNGGNPTESWYLPFNLIGFSARTTYNYSDKYFAEFNMGYNGSEQFAPDNRFGFFPSVSAGWLISKENFLKNNSVLTMLKIRGSYGLVGNDQLGGNRFLYLDNVKVNGGGYASNLGRGQQVNEISMGNPNIKWEIAKKSNIGIEIGLFRDLNLTLDVFEEKRENMLIYRQTVPGAFGFPGSLPPLNVGKMSNHGYEFEMTYSKTVSQDFSVLSKFNFNYSKNIVDYIDEAKLSDDYAYQYRGTGYTYGQNFGYVANGYWNSQEEIVNSGLTFAGQQPFPGDLKLEDVNGDKTVDERDISPIGYSDVPQYTFGLSSAFTYKELDLSILLQGASNVSRYLTGFGVFENSGNITVYRSRMLNAWTPERAASGAKIDYPALTSGSSYGQANANNSFWLENTSYLRIKNIELGYNFKKDAAKKIGASGIRLYANGLNLFTVSKMRNKDFDPEISGNLTYPINRTINLGAKLTF